MIGKSLSGTLLRNRDGRGTKLCLHATSTYLKSPLPTQSSMESVTNGGIMFAANGFLTVQKIDLQKRSSIPRACPKKALRQTRGFRVNWTALPLPQRVANKTG